MTFVEAVRQLRVIAGGRYCVIAASATMLHTGELQLEFKWYIDGEGGYQVGFTSIDECVANALAVMTARGLGPERVGEVSNDCAIE